jgi:sensor c-di-GMP phosphodiesterase-like protein
MRLLQSRLFHFSIIAFSAAAFAGAAHVTLNAVIDTQNRKQISELNRLILHRAELAADYAFIALGEMMEKGVLGCDASALREFRRHVYQRSTVKDIRAVDANGAVICSAFPETLEFDVSSMSAADALASRNTQVLLLRLDQQSGSALGVMWQVTTDVALVAVVGTDALLYDMLPAELRDRSEMILKLENGAAVARFMPNPRGGALVEPAVFSAQSARYPLLSEICVEGSVLAAWNKDPQPLFLSVVGLIGLAFGWLIVRAMARPKSAIMELDDALAAKEFRPFMQPVFSLQSGEIVGCEVLARWVRSDGTVIPPSRFIPLAEDSGRIVPLTHQIVAQALVELKPFMRSNKHFTVAFNIVAAHLSASGFVDELRKLVSDAGVSARQIVIELTEREELRDLEKAAGVIAELRGHGFKVAIDDAGTGHSGLSYIQKLGVNTIKIDKFFVDSIGSDHTAQAVVEMLVRLARQLGMTTVAEGIESREQIAALEACGVDEGQGYVVSPPVPAVDFLAMLRERQGRRASEAAAVERAA